MFAMFAILQWSLLIFQINQRHVSFIMKHYTYTIILELKSGVEHPYLCFYERVLEYDSSASRLVGAPEATKQYVTFTLLYV